jgi:hypothetical protein
MNYACPVWELAADTYLLKLQRLQNKVLHAIINFPGAHWSTILHTAFSLPYVAIIQQSCASNKWKSYKIMRMNMFAV